jgi:hypothetical protein
MLLPRLSVLRGCLVAVLAGALASGCGSSREGSIGFSAPGSAGAGAFAVTTGALPAATPGNAYAANLTATGAIGTLSWSLSSGELPLGITLSPDGFLGGTPAGQALPTATFVVEATDPGRGTSVTKALSISVATGSLSIIATGSTLPEGALGQSYSVTFETEAGSPPVTWSVTSGAATLPSGLVLSSAGTLQGIPTTAGVSTFQVDAVEADGTVSTKAFALTIAAAGHDGPTIATSSLPPVTGGVFYEVTLQASGGTPPYTWSLPFGSALPAGLSLSQGGVISGTTVVGGYTSFQVALTDASTPAKPPVVASETLFVNEPL